MDDQQSVVMSPSRRSADSNSKSPVEHDSREVPNFMSISSKARIITKHEVQYPDPIEVVAGETVLVGDEDREYPGWKWCRASNEREGWVPVELISTQGAEATVLEDYSARELSVSPGEVNS